MATAEKVRLVAKAAAAVAGFFFIMTATRDRSEVGAEFAIGIGAPLLLAGVLDVVWTVQNRLEHIFIESRPLQLVAHAGMALVGAALVVVGVVGKVT